MQKNLRPQTFKEFIGQSKIKKTLRIMINSSKKRKKQLDHILLFGPPGIGKTSLANVISTEMGKKLKYAQGPLFDKKSDILTFIASIQKGDVMFIDEIHGINKNIEELLYSAVEDGVIDLTIGPEGDAKLVRLKIPKFTLIGATTKVNKISIPLKNRFGIIFKLKNYNEEDIFNIVTNSAKQMKEKIDDQAITLVATHSRFNPRIANNILKRTIDFFVDSNEKIISKKIVDLTLDSIGIYKYGLEDSHIDYLKILDDIFYEKWASIENLSSISKEEKINIEQYIETPLLELNFIEKSSRGRKITTKGIKYLNTYKLV